MSAPRHPPEHPPGFVPLGDLSELRSAAAWHLLIPTNTYTVLDAARQAKLDLAVMKEDEHESSSVGPAVATLAEVVPAPRCARPRHIQVFGPEALALANEHMQGADRGQRRYAETLLERAGSNEGYRALPRVRSALKKLETARSVFGNLSEPILLTSLRIVRIALPNPRSQDVVEVVDVVVDNPISSDRSLFEWHEVDADLLGIGNYRWDPHP